MIAVIKTGGKQYIVKKGDKLRIEKLETKEGEQVIFDEVLLYSKDNNELQVGTPILQNIKVEAIVRKHAREKKVMTGKYKAKKRYHVRKGHRQWYTEVEITNISV